MQDPKTHALHGLTKSKLLSPVNTRFKPVKVLYTSRLRTSSAGCVRQSVTLSGSRHMPRRHRLMWGFVRQESAEVAHRWAIYDEWNTGCSFGPPHVWCFAGTDSRQHGMEHVHMLVPGLSACGTVTIRTTHRKRHFKIKGYPQLVLVMRSSNSRLQGSLSETLQSIRNQAAWALRMIHNLVSKEDQAV